MLCKLYNNTNQEILLPKTNISPVSVLIKFCINYVCDSIYLHIIGKFKLFLLIVIESSTDPEPGVITELL